MITNVLLTGYTNFVTNTFLAETFPNCRILVTGDPGVKDSAADRISVRRDDLNAKTCREVFSTYEFDEIVYFSRSLAPFSSADGSELEKLSIVLEECLPESRMIYVTGPRHPEDSTVSVVEAAAQEMCRRSSLQRGEVNVVLSPWIYNMESSQPALDSLFLPGEHVLPVPEDQQCTFLAAEDLSTLLQRMFENWEYSFEPYEIPNVFQCSAKRLTALIIQNAPQLDIAFQFSKEKAYPIAANQNQVLKNQFMWFPVYSLMEDLPELMRSRAKKRSVFREQLSRLFGRAGLLMRIAELLVGFVLMELLMKLTGISAQFRMIDFRLLFVVIMGTMYNIPMGLAAAALESVSLVYAYSLEGTGALNLFYEPTNWLPFIAYFTVGAICGYVRAKDRNLLAFANGETTSITERYEYLQQLNEEVLQEKKEYKQQIIGSRDSFGKIFEITQQLNESHPRHVVGRALQVIETVMSSSGVAIYRTMGQSAYGRLSVASAGLNADRSLKLAPYYRCLNMVNDEEVWVNRDLDMELPSYLYAIRRDGKIEVIVMLRNASFEQMTLYYENLFRVICGLISNSLIKAMDYQTAIHREKCVQNTQNTYQEQYFLDELRIALDEMEKKQASHLLLRVNEDADDMEALEQRISRCVRINDIIGVIGGQVYILLMQAQESDFPMINTRFESKGLSVSTISYQEQSGLARVKAG